MKTLPIFLCLSQFLFAKEPVSLPSLTVGAKTYESPTITREGELGVKIFHASGVTRAQLADLSPDVRDKLGVDPAQQAAAEQKQAEAQRIAGLQAERAQAKARMIANGEARDGVFRVNNIHEDGIVGIFGSKMISHQGKFVIVQDGKVKGDVFIHTKIKKGKFVDNEIYPFTIIRNGTHTFTTVLGASRTIPKWLDIELILDAKFPETAS
jgi:hypothetical protein